MAIRIEKNKKRKIDTSGSGLAVTSIGRTKSGYLLIHGLGRLGITKYDNGALINRVVDIFVMMNHRGFFVCLFLDKGRLALYGSIKVYQSILVISLSSFNSYIQVLGQSSVVLSQVLGSILEPVKNGHSI